MKTPFECLRVLAKRNDYQNLFSYSKELNHIRLFSNDTNFSVPQIYFLRYLNFYYTIFTDIYLGEIDETVLDDQIYEDSYVLFKNKKHRKVSKTHAKETPILSHTNKWVFRSPKK